MSKFNVLNPFTLDLDSHSKLHGTVNNEPSMTVQADKEQADINNIVRQFGITRQLPYGVSVPSFDDFSDSPSDFHAAMNYIRESNQLFMEYPSEIRSRFDNDAGNFINFLNNPVNKDEAIRLGFVNPPQAEPVATATGDNAGAASD